MDLVTGFVALLATVLIAHAVYDHFTWKAKARDR
jgi:hypothetical protein